MHTCISCKEDAETIINCDGCKKVLCEKCSGLSSSELRCIALKKRRLIFLCEECEGGFKLLPLLMSKVEKLEKQVQELSEVQYIKRNSAEPENYFTEFENVVSELEERRRRAKNIIMININESGQKNRRERVNEEIETVKQILGRINVSTEGIKVFRIGKFVPGRNRPIKVIFPAKENAVEVLKQKNQINIRGLIIFGDQTKKQRDYYQFIKEKLNELKEKGDNTKTIKYINGVPTIVTADVETNRSSQKN